MKIFIFFSWSELEVAEDIYSKLYDHHCGFYHQSLKTASLK